MKVISVLKVLLVTLVLVPAISGCAMFGGEREHSGYVGTAAMDQEQITRLLDEKGYTNITGLHMNGPDWIGSAINRNGQQVNFDIDKGGTIHTR